MDYLSAPISIYKNQKDTTGRPGTFADYLLLCYDSAGAVADVRAATTPEERRALKDKLPAATLHGQFTERNDAHLAQHSGLMCVDVDGVPPAPLMALLRTCPHVFFATPSCSGAGVMAVVPVTDPANIKGHYNAFANWLGTHGYPRQTTVNGNKISGVDMSCINPSRLRYATWAAGPDMVLHLDAVPYADTAGDTPPPAPSAPQRRQVQRAATAQLGPNHPAAGMLDATATRARVEALIAEIERRQLDIAPDEPTWFKIALALAREYEEEGRDMYHRVNRFYPGYDYAENDKKYTHALAEAKKGTGRDINIGTFIYKAETALGL